MTPIPTLDSARLRFDPLCESDLDTIFHLYSNPDVVRLFGQDRMTETAHAQYWLDIQGQMRQLDLGATWVLRLKESGQAVGTFSFDGINRQWHNVGISYALHPDYWRRGLMTETLQTMVAFAWCGALAGPMHRIQALVYMENTASVALLRKVGFVREGARLGLVFWQQRYWDLESFCLLNPSDPPSAAFDTH
ncbi:MAG: GNAT family N-acetyltransferase [Paludibacterium sp.]|uniref:GNAT family N-acetyltransferase n=1 Tax=Paludibacterium sp. TaxID=1917523 RepID=UPI0025DCA55B|nr:GNAT family N-acetyltransferase [Paludibacterium sp.]MBV8048505.1 GNAT family N-acetyltransferase [Paludibacterium sp.]MBV8647365.1 GNAT family N-acetyltransferase [Paludibacterium sp.]